MSFRPLVEGDCGGINPLVQLGQRFTRDSAFKEEGFSQKPFNSDVHQQEMISEFLGQVAGPPQTFRMDNLLEEMREIEQQNFHPPILHGPKVIQEVAGGSWIHDFNDQKPRTDLIQKNMNSTMPMNMNNNFVNENGTLHNYHLPIMSAQMFSQPNFINVQPPQNHVTYAKQFFDETPQDEMQEKIRNFFDEDLTDETEMQNNPNEWLEDFQKNKMDEAQKSESYYDKFWSKLQKDWNDLSDVHPWLSPMDSEYDLYKEYEFADNNSMQQIENALEKGKEFLQKGDIPSAVLCFEAAVKQNDQTSEGWELLGYSQQENEMDPHAIAALKKALNLQPNNLRILMALAVSYTNESLQSQALNMLGKWLYKNPIYKHLVPENLVADFENPSVITSSLIGHSALKEIQNLFLNAVQMNPQQIDPDVQEALGVIFNLSSEYDKAVDCFQTALSVNPSNAKVWNRLGASLANGNRSVEAVEAYKRALDIEPGFIRARYNVGIICMNLKSYKESAEHLLMALNMQATSPTRSGFPETVIAGSSQMSDVIWNTIKMVFALMGNDDLKQAAAKRDLNVLNQIIKLEEDAQ